jgi:hypothetical protein
MRNTAPAGVADMPRGRTRTWVAAFAALLTLAAPAVARADAVTDWNKIASDTIVTRGAQPPHAASLSFAIVQGAVYDAVNAIDRRHRPYLAQPAANPWDSKEAAAATAAYRTLVGLFPAQLSTLEPLYDAYIASLPDEPAGSRAAGVAVGAATAAEMLAGRENDGRGIVLPPTRGIPDPGTPVGVWRPAAPDFFVDQAAWVGNVTPFLIESPSQFRSDGPNGLGSAAYAQDFNEVKTLGSLTSTIRTADQTDAAIFWQDHGFALWNRIERDLAAQQRLGIADSARLFAMSNMAAADAAIS